MPDSGKVVIYVANQANMETLGKEECDALEKEAKDLEERQKEVNAELKAASSGTKSLRTDIPLHL